MAEGIGPLAGIRVLDLATSRAELAGRSLADLGAEVIKIEPPGGVDSRRIPPFDNSGGPRHGESLYWAAVGLGKRSVVLDLESEDGQAEFRKLAIAADVVIESFDPGWMDSLGVGYEALSAANPALIYMAVTPYGQFGPKAHWPATDLTIEAASSRISRQGDPDRPPLPIGYPQSAFHAGGQAACDIVIALNERAISGRGQFLDLSMQEAMIWTLMDGPGYPPNTGYDPPGSGDDRAWHPSAASLIACADGWVNGRVANVDLSPYPKAHLMKLAVEQDVRLAPVNTTKDLIESVQFAGRGFWAEVEGYVHPGLSYRLSRTKTAISAPAPALGEHQSLSNRADNSADARATTVDGERVGLAFAGLKVADFSWVAVGPITAKAFADHGATVVRVESETRIDVLRGLPPFKDDYPTLNRSQWFANMNSSKLGLSLNLRTPEGREVARKLIDWADVVVESFTPGTMAKLGLDYETVSKDHPDLIMLSTCLLGQTGPYATYGGFGGHGAAIAGLHAITGWPDRPPCGPAGPYSDVCAPRFTVAALTAAVLERRKSGLGQHIDVSQVESAMHFIEPLVLDQTVNGVTAGPAGMDSLTACPHGVFQAAGTERYVTLAVETPAQWRALKTVAPLADFEDARFDSLAERHAAGAEITRALLLWTMTQDPWQLEADLIAAGVPCSVVQRASDLYHDPQLAHRGFFVTLDHPEMGPTPYDGFATRFSAREEMLRGPAPLLGQHTETILRDFLGMTDEEIIASASAGGLM